MSNRGAKRKKRELEVEQGREWKDKSQPCYLYKHSSALTNETNKWKEE